MWKFNVIRVFFLHIIFFSKKVLNDKAYRRYKKSIIGKEIHGLFLNAQHLSWRKQRRFARRYTKRFFLQNLQGVTNWERTTKRRFGHKYILYIYYYNTKYNKVRQVFFLLYMYTYIYYTSKIYIYLHFKNKDLNF